MYAVIKTGGKQYRVQPGDVLVVEKLDGEPGADVAFGEVLMLGDGAAVTVGAPTVSGASVNATLIETRKGLKVKIFKKTRRQGYRRTRGHRQFESVLRVTGITGDGKSAKWDGTVDLTTKAVIDARARGLALRDDVTPTSVVEEAPQVEVEAVAADAATETAAPAKKAAPRKAAAPKAEAGEAKPAAKKPTAKKTDTDAE
ncbi:50S ribosomal protein L21 [Phenylobacterium sp.]|uniref:50S ribosomal protein L21 n=1 Tax=Phenylobacterium sp. TaxID=1871053 RepID=UPI002734F2B9|nr:50S ribosomal protein L21 [Phenylobacterium sp.]MDP3659301.1 50S ribosomal protein L21 [Phenylobacterium sp.]